MSLAEILQAKEFRAEIRALVKAQDERIEYFAQSLIDLQNKYKALNARMGKKGESQGS